MLFSMGKGRQTFGEKKTHFYLNNNNKSGKYKAAQLAK